MLNKVSVDDINVKGQRVLVRCDFGLAIAYYFFTTQVNKAPAVAAEGAVIDEGDEWDE